MNELINDSEDGEEAYWFIQSLYKSPWKMHYANHNRYL